MSVKRKALHNRSCLKKKDNEVCWVLSAETEVQHSKSPDEL